MGNGLRRERLTDTTIVDLGDLLSRHAASLLYRRGGSGGGMLEERGEGYPRESGDAGEHGVGYCGGRRSSWFGVGGGSYGGGGKRQLRLRRKRRRVVRVVVGRRRC